MFRQPTVFILGAGAHHEFGLPLGSGLMSAVETNLRIVGREPKTESADEFLRLLKNKFGPDYPEYLKAGRDLVQVMKRFSSMDEALHYLSANAKCVVVGKAAIVCSILNAENDSRVQLRSFGRPDLSMVAKTWAPRFLSMALSGLRREDISSIFDNVTIINFNYDRSLEQYLYWALQKEALVSASEATEIVKGMKVLRPYGSVGPLTWEGDHGIQYGGPSQISVSVFQTADGIRTYTEQFQSQLRTQIDEALTNAKLIAIMGFGFHSQNVELFGPPESRRTDHRHVFATVHSITEENHQLLRDQLGRCFKTRVPVHLSKKTAVGMLTDLQPSISAAAR